MAQHLVAYYESIDPAGALANIAAVPDESVFVSGDDIRIPRGMAQILGTAVLADDASAARAQLQSPSLRSFINIDIEPVVAAAVFGSPPEQIYHPARPIPMTPDESINLQVESNPASAEAHYGLVFLGDGVQQPVSGPIYSVRATGAASLSAGTWVNTSLTFAQTLPFGDYRVVGFRARGTNLVAARMVFVGSPWRPGVAAVNAIGDRDLREMRQGRCGVLGTFNSNTPPTVDCLGVTDSAQEFIIDLQRM